MLCCAVLPQVGAMVQTRHNPGSESFRERDRDSWPQLTESDRDYLSVKRRERLQDIVSKACSQVIKSAMGHHVSVGWAAAVAAGCWVLGAGCCGLKPSCAAGLGYRGVFEA
jgi:hypothetical protein